MPDAVIADAGRILLPLTGTNTVVTTTAVRLAAAPGQSNKVHVYNSGTGPIFYGGSNVNVSNGIALTAGTVKDFDLGPNDELYAVSTVTSTFAPGKASVVTFQR